MKPRLTRVAITNAFGRCPTDDGTRFRTPTEAEVSSDDNRARLSSDVAKAIAMCSAGDLRVVTIGEIARTALQLLGPLQGVEIHHIAHPSRQGLLQAQPNHGKGTHIADLRKGWESQLTSLLDHSI